MQSPAIASASATTLVHILKQRAALTPERNAYIFLEDGEDQERPISYGELDRRARLLAATLQQRVPQAHGSRVLLMYPQGLEFLVAFFGSLYAGATAVLVYPPTNAKMARRLAVIAADCDVAAVLSTTHVIGKMTRMAAEGLSELPCINTDLLDAELEGRFVEQDIRPEHIAFLQYTSGSTGTPKGVMISHANLMANQRTIQELYRSDGNSVVVGWLPLIHDMGLIGKALHPLYLGVPLVFMSPLHFMQRPVRWLRAIDKYRATISGGPNFAYDLCAAKVSDEDLQALDLSCWTTAFNGAEPVRRETMERFYRRFAGCGLPPHALMAVYGLAEATLIVSGTRRDVLLAADAATDYMPSGHAAAWDTVKVVDVVTGTEAPEGREGEVWVSGPSVAVGYWNQPQVNREIFQAQLADSPLRYLRTGDTGYVRNGCLHITGRIKDIVIIQGRNYHAEDIEWSLANLKGLRAGCAAAFSTDEGGKERLVVVAGATASDPDETRKLVAAMREAIYADHQLPLDRVVLIRPKDLPMTTSGKVQRRLTKKMLLAGEFEALLDQSGDATPDADHGRFVAPGTPAERELAAVWSQILALPLDKIGIHDNFFDLGGSSLTMLQLSDRIQASMELLFRYPTIAGYLYRTSEYEYPDVASDIRLPPLALDESLTGRTGLTMVTGAHGFFGLHFLRSMMKRSDDRFALLLRGKDGESLERRFEQAVDYFGMRAEIDLDRLEFVEGDLSKPHAGISDADWASLATCLDRIVHIGSHVNNWLPYEGIRQINVEGTRSLLELARTGRRKEFHYTSTSTFSPLKEDTSVFDEDDEIDPGEINRYFGYDISKYASEAMCRLARADGITCNIYRLVWVGGHLDTGVTKMNDGLNIMLRMLLTLGVYPQGNYLHDVVPVDLMADAMASLVGKTPNGNYNVTSQSRESIDMKRIATMLRTMGYELTEVSRAEFVQRLKDYPAEKWDEHCRSYRQLVIRLFEDPTPKIESFYDSRNFRRDVDPDILARMERKFIDAWFEKTVQFLVRKNALPTPRHGLYSDDLKSFRAWNRTEADVPRDQCLHQRFALQAAATPDAVALRYSGGSTSYRELDCAANRIAHRLLARGARPGELVGLSVNRSPALIAAILGIFKAGCAYVPLDPTYPVASLDVMIEDCGARRIVVDAAAGAQLARHAGKLLDVAALASGDYDGGEPGAPDVPARASCLAYVIYTSGSTGKPKGVMVEHRSVINHNESLMRAFALTPADKVLQFSTVNFDSFIEEVFPTLFTGATLVLVDKGELNDVERLKAVITSESVSVLKFSTAYWHNLSDLSVSALGVRLVGIGGEAADLARYNAWRAKNGAIPLVNTYGPTETTVTATLATFHGPLERMHIGKPILNTQVYVLDAQLSQVPVGFVGELYIGGAGVTRGYLNRPEANAAAFLADRFRPGETFYKTGDMVRWLPDGTLEFLGRADHQVKVRGYRIELGAIEGALASHPQVADTAVVVKEVDTRKKIVAYYKPRDAAVAGGELRAWLEEQLPSYMIPNLLLPLAEIPMNPNGKVDRRVLELMPVDASQHVDFAAPTTLAEIKMARAWESVLGVDGIGLNDEFSELGGHSLLAMPLIQQVNEQFDTSLAIGALYEHPTVAKLLAHVSRESQDAQPSNLIRFPEQGRKGQRAAALRPLFLVHGLGGHLASFYPLVKNLKQNLHEQHGLDITVYGLEANGFREGEAHFEDLDQMVAAYVQQLREVQPQGPYLLGGWSYGVSIAFHIAQELIRTGDEVGLFISIDAEAPNVPKDFEAFIEEHGIMTLDDLYEDGRLKTLLVRFGRRFGFVCRDDEPARQQFHRFLGYAHGNGAQPVDADLERHSKVAIANLFNARGFKPRPIAPLNTLLVRASGSRFDNYLGDWANLVDSRMLASLTLAGDHWSIMQDPELAAQLASQLARHAAPSTQALAA
ncbi:hypothetical protein GCM10028796_09150 [Ramlibacter monticola]|uniref:Amino acid adenylation domain-containing protein n=1 Tax=Ramlibacter monticola TaxID=1926872 RepID=A0A936YUT1_9BURK|nr:non-ribosomal peptide synthetase [Ramlibacter monticola]MBL0389773.1 amino acid adenylation domain-containing protein [Ramlibacter monticola]